jgi:hypothetical protein
MNKRTVVQKGKKEENIFYVKSSLIPFKINIKTIKTIDLDFIVEYGIEICLSNK